jgi:hypothetical protein
LHAVLVWSRMMCASSRNKVLCGSAATGLIAILRLTLYPWVFPLLASNARYHAQKPVRITAGNRTA